MARRVIVYEDEAVLRKHLESVFYSLREEYLLLDLFPDAENVIEQVESYKPDVVILDIRMINEEDGLYALHKIKSTMPEVKVMMLTTFDNDDKVVNAICLGADGYMLKTDFSGRQLPHEVIRRSLNIIFEGGAYLTPRVAKKILELLSHPSLGDLVRKVRERFSDILNKEGKKPQLSRMQTIVLQGIVEGKTTSEIAAEHKLSENTINTHIKAIYNTMGVHSRATAIKRAIEEKWLKA